MLEFFEKLYYSFKFIGGSSFAKFSLFIWGSSIIVQILMTIKHIYKNNPRKSIKYIIQPVITIGVYIYGQYFYFWESGSWSTTLGWVLLWSLLTGVVIIGSIMLTIHFLMRDL